MNQDYLPAFAALMGSALGGFTSLATSWLNLHTQAKTNQLTQERVKRETLYSLFIEEASALYADAFEHDRTDISKLSRLYAMISRMRLLTSKPLVEQAEKATQKIIDTYLEPNRSFCDVREMIKTREIDPLRQFSEVCREDLKRFGIK